MTLARVIVVVDDFLREETEFTVLSVNPEVLLLHQLRRRVASPSFSAGLLSLSDAIASVLTTPCCCSPGIPANPVR